MQSSVGLIGVGAFGEFILPHLLPYCRIAAYDPIRDLAPLTEKWAVVAADLETVAGMDIVILAMPVQRIGETCRQIAPLLKPGALVLDVCSVKEEPVREMVENLPDTVDIIGTHPLFGPQTGANGIEGLNMTVCNVRGDRGPCVVEFLRDRLKLKVIEATPEVHDKELAYVQGLTHLISRIVVEMDIPELAHTTETFSIMHKMIESVRYDSEELFRAIENRNRFVSGTRESFFEAARVIEDRLSNPSASKE